MIYDKTNQELLEELDSRVEGHIDAKKALINLVNRCKLRHHQKWGLSLPDDELIETANCLLIGDSGTGKTFLVETLQSIVYFPLVKIDGSRLTNIGADSSGTKVTDIEKYIREKANELVKLEHHYPPSVEGTLDQMVVFIDEFDKITNSFESSGKWNKQIQSTLLTLLDNRDEFAGVSFILAGAFVDLKKNSNQESGKIGFVKEKSKKETKKLYDKLLVKNGMIPEIVGRISNIVVLDEFTKERYKDILVNRLLPKKQEEMKHFNNFNFQLSDEDIEEIIESAAESGQGVRFLKRELDKKCSDIEFDYEVNAIDRILDPETIWV